VDAAEEELPVQLTAGQQDPGLQVTRVAGRVTARRAGTGSTRGSGRGRQFKAQVSGSSRRREGLTVWSPRRWLFRVVSAVPSVRKVVSGHRYAIPAPSFV